MANAAVLSYQNDDQKTSYSRSKNKLLFARSYFVKLISGGERNEKTILYRDNCKFLLLGITSCAGNIEKEESDYRTNGQLMDLFAEEGWKSYCADDAMLLAKRR